MMDCVIFWRAVGGDSLVARALPLSLCLVVLLFLRRDYHWQNPPEETHQGDPHGWWQLRPGIDDKAPKRSPTLLLALGVVLWPSLATVDLPAEAVTSRHGMLALPFQILTGNWVLVPSPSHPWISILTAHVPQLNICPVPGGSLGTVCLHSTPPPSVGPTLSPPA